MTGAKRTKISDGVACWDAPVLLQYYKSGYLNLNYTWMERSIWILSYLLLYKFKPVRECRRPAWLLATAGAAARGCHLRRQHMGGGDMTSDGAAVSLSWTLHLQGHDASSGGQRCAEPSG